MGLALDKYEPALSAGIMAAEDAAQGLNVTLEGGVEELMGCLFSVSILIGLD